MTSDDFDHLSRSVVLNVLQNHGQSIDQKAAVLQQATVAAGLKCRVWSSGADIFTQGRDGDLMVGFCEDLKKCWPLGRVEVEIAAVRNVIVRWRKRQTARRKRRVALTAVAVLAGLALAVAGLSFIGAW